MKLSVVIPVYNEVNNIEKTISDIDAELRKNSIDFEIVVVNDHSNDGTKELLDKLNSANSKLLVEDNFGQRGYGGAVRKGLDVYNGDAVAIMMGDSSDLPEDLVRFFNTMKDHDYDCVFGSRFHKEGRTVDYPLFKLILNRLFNNFIRFLFCIKYNDMTNAFKLYRRNVIEGVRPLLSPHFNLTVEIPLKAVVRGYSYAVLPNTWINRKKGESKLKIREMGSRYMFILLYCFIEKWLTKNDFKKNNDSL